MYIFALFNSDRIHKYNLLENTEINAVYTRLIYVIVKGYISYNNSYNM